MSFSKSCRLSRNRGALPLALGGAVVREVGGEGFAPVAALVGDVDEVPEPAVDQFVVEVARRQRLPPLGGALRADVPDHRVAEERELREAVARGEEVLDDVEAAVGDGPEDRLEARDLLLERREEDPRVRAVLLVEVGAAGDSVDRALLDRPGAGHDDDAVVRVAAVVGDDVHPLLLALLHPLSLRDGAMRKRHADRHAEGKGLGGGKVEAADEIAPVGADRAGRRVARDPGRALRLLHRVAQRAAEREPHRLRTLGHAQRLDALLPEEDLDSLHRRNRDLDRTLRADQVRALERRVRGVDRDREFVTEEPRRGRGGSGEKRENGEESDHWGPCYDDPVAL